MILDPEYHTPPAVPHAPHTPHTQGAGRLDVIKSREVLATYKPRASLVPAHLHFGECPYMWPFCRQAFYAGAMPVMFNATVLNGMGVVGGSQGRPGQPPRPAAQNSSPDRRPAPCLGASPALERGSQGSRMGREGGR